MLLSAAGLLGGIALLAFGVIGTFKSLLFTPPKYHWSIIGLVLGGSIGIGALLVAWALPTWIYEVGIQFIEPKGVPGR